MPRKKLVHVNQRSVRRDGAAGRSARNSSPIPRSGPRARTGLKNDMIDSGTTIVRVQADIALKLKFNRDGQEDQLGWNTRALVVADLAQERQVEPREAVALGCAAGQQNRPPRPRHRRKVGDRYR